MKEQKQRLLTVILVLITILTGVSASAVLPDGDFHLQVLNVGQGDAILITTPSNVRILIDGGPGDAVLAELGSVLPFFSQKIDLVILTHPDADHLAGLVPVLRRYNVQAVLRTDATKSTAVFNTFLQSLSASQTRDERLYAGDSISISDGTKFTVLWPLTVAIDDKSVNESSIVTQLSYQGYKFLLTGDIGEVSEAQIGNIIKDEYLKSDVLKVPHHGSKNSSSSWFLQKVAPRVSIISVGADNFYGHPTPEVLERLGQLHSELFRTDVDGRVSVTVNSEGMYVKADN